MSEPRKTWTGKPMAQIDAATLVNLARARYGRENVRLAVLVRTGAVEQVVDNAADCHESILRLRAAPEEH